MSASPQDLMTAKLFFNAAFPTMQVLLDDDPKLHKKFQNFNATVQFGAMNDGELLCCHLIFQNGNLTVVQGPAEKSDISLTFSSVEKMNSLLKGGLSLPSIKGNLSLLPNVLSILMGLKIMTKPNDKLKNDTEKLLKVKCSLYMITRALSQYNKLGDPDMQEFCRRQPDRIYQFQVEHDGLGVILHGRAVFPAGQGIEVAVFALAPAKGDVDVDPKGFELLFHRFLLIGRGVFQTEASLAARSWCRLRR